MDNDYAIILENISKKYRLYSNKKDRMKEALDPFKRKFHKDFFAVKDLDLKVKKGEILGIVGRNGAGKSTLLKMIAGVIQPTSGKIITKGNIVPLLELGSGFNPEYTGLENIYFYSSIMGLTKKTTDQKLQEIINFADIGDFIHQPIKTYSSGMKTRLAFAVSINIDPDILILDEILAVGDELFRRKSYAKMEEFFKAGKTILFVSHSAQSVNELCTNAILLNNGKILLDGPPKMVTMYYQKMIYSKGENLNKVLDEINDINTDPSKKSEFFSSEINKNKNKTKKVVETGESTNSDTKRKNVINKRIIDSEAAFYVKEFKPKSTTKFSNFDVEIKNVCIKTLDSRIVNHLVTGSEFVLHFDIIFNVDLKNINVGVSFKDEKGVIITGLSTRNSNMIIPEVTKGSSISAEFKFICQFTRGIYYIDIGANDVNRSDLSFIIKYDDIINFKVIEGNQNIFHNWGIIDLKISPKIVLNRN